MHERDTTCHIQQRNIITKAHAKFILIGQRFSRKGVKVKNL